MHLETNVVPNKKKLFASVINHLEVLMTRAYFKGFLLHNIEPVNFMKIILIQLHREGYFFQTLSAMDALIK